MSTSAVSGASINQQIQQYYQTRQTDLKQLGQALRSGDVGSAQTAFNNIVSLGQSGPFANGVPFVNTTREQDFTAVGQALQSGDLAGAQKAFVALGDTFKNGRNLAPPPSNSNSASGPEIVLNLSNNSGGASPEQVTINIANSANGGEQVSLSLGEQGSNPQQITFNLSPISNEQIIVNFPGAGASVNSSGSSDSSTSGGSPASGGISVSA